MSMPSSPRDNRSVAGPLWNAAAGRDRKREVRSALLLIALCGAPAVAGPRGDTPPEPWPAELGPAFELYYADEFLEVQRLCQQVRGTSRDPLLRREATTLGALATMRLPGRTNQTEGQAWLAQLAEEDPSLLERPECQLAYGIAETALSATASALYHLDQAAETFAARGQTARLAQALVALAEAWALHGEWEATVPGMDIPRPESRAGADRIRTERISALRQRAAALPGCEAEVAQIELILARHLLQTETGRAEGSTLLEELARRAELTKTSAQAGLALGERYEAARRWNDAAQLYARIAAGGLGTLSEQAQQRRSAIQRPQLVLDVPAQVAIGQRVEVKLAVRNLNKLGLEVRRVDLADWLEQRQGRFAEGALPTTGALVAVRDLGAEVPAEHDWWAADTIEEPLTFEAPAGAVVVLAHASDAGGNTVVAKRLVLAGNLQAALFVAGPHATLWTTRAAPTAQPVEPTARFWMHGSFVPTRPQVSDGTAIFALPPEARVLRDKRWVCLVEAGEEVTLCHGTLPESSSPQYKPAVALIGGPPEVRVGETLRVFGRLLGGSLDATVPDTAQAVELELLDVLDTALDTTSAAVDDVGTFSAEIPIASNAAGKKLRVAVRLDGQTLQSVSSTLNVYVPPLDATPLNVTCSLPNWSPPLTGAITARIAAAYPWGTAASETPVNTRMHAVGLPTTLPRREPVQGRTIRETRRINREGTLEFVQPLSVFHLPDGPRAVELRAETLGWDGRRSQQTALALIGPEPVHLWIGGQTSSLQAGNPVQIPVNWFDPPGRTAGTRPNLAVWREGILLANLRLLPAVSGMLSEVWRPTAAGSHELVATLTQIDGEPLTVRETIQVATRAGADPEDVAPLRYDAQFAQHDDQSCVHVRLEGRWQRPLLLLLEAGDPLAARQLPALERPTDLLIPLPGLAPAETRLILATSDREGVRILGACDVRPADEQALTLALSANLDTPAPGASIEISATCLRGDQPASDATLMARLVDLSSIGGVQWLPEADRPDFTQLPGGVQVVSSGKFETLAGDADVIAESRQLSPALAEALFEGTTLWVDRRRAGDAPTSFTVPLPATPGQYRVVVAAQTPDHAFACKPLDLDTTNRLHIVADVPAQLMLGDRTIASLTITNPRPTMVSARVSFDGGDGLHADEWRPADPTTRVERSEDGTALAVPLPPTGTVTLHARAEAVRPGPRTATFLVETEYGQRRATASYSVWADPADRDDVSRETVRITRKLWLLRHESAMEGDAFAGTGVPTGQPLQWLRFELKPDERVTPGQLILVQEEFSLTEPLTRVHWEQRLPGNCLTHAGAWSDLRRIGTAHRLRLDALAYDAVRLAEQRRHIHEYVIVPVRPGACRFPPPTVTSADTPVPVEVASPTPRLIVADQN